ncbi:MAG TPA: DUF3108 domain-containing protein [Burkholderiaceae bacterium]|nr:DUF3108 domain-containing protein [Burkholderiaceae bacterium]
MSSIPLTIGRSDLALRAAIALALAVMMHGAALLTLAGVRILLPGREPTRSVIEAALLPPAQAPVKLPPRRAVARTAPSRHSGAGRAAVAPLQAVRTDVAATRRAKPVAAPAPPAQAAAAPAPGPPSDHRVATAAPTVPVEAAPPVLPVPADQPAAAVAPPPAAPVAPPPAAPVAAPPAAPAAPQPAAPAASQPAASAMAAPAAPARPAHAPVQVVLPRSARLVYASFATVRAGGFVLPVRGRTTTRWQFRDGHYQLNLSIDVVNFVETSQGLFDPDFGLEPERYSETRPHHPVSTTRFDWANRRVSFTDDSRQGEAEPGTQDRLSVQFQLSVLRQVYPELFVRGTVVPITLAGTRDVSRWTFTVTGEDIVDSGLGHLPALRVLSNRTTASGDESLEVWISEKLNWFPARIRMIDRNRNVLDFVLDEATID